MNAEPSAMRLCGAIVWFVTCSLTCQESAIIHGPVPQVEIAPLNSTVEFRCKVNTSELTAGRSFSSITWNKDGLVVSSTIGVARSSTITLTVTEENLSGVAIQCSVIINNPLDQIFSVNATLITYGI